MPDTKTLVRQLRDAAVSVGSENEINAVLRYPPDVSKSFPEMLRAESALLAHVEGLEEKHARGVLTRIEETGRLLEERDALRAETEQLRGENKRLREHAAYCECLESSPCGEFTAREDAPEWCWTCGHSAECHAAPTKEGE